MEFFTILETRSSEFISKGFLSKRSTHCIPDFFIIIFCMTLFTFSAVLDFFILFSLICSKDVVTVTVFALSGSMHGIFEFFTDRDRNLCCLKPGEGIRKFVIQSIVHKLVVFPLYLLGFGSIFMFIRVLIETLQGGMFVEPLPVFSHPFFHISEENLFIIKVYCCTTVVLKCIPQLFIMSIYILEKYANDKTAIMFVTNILFNILIFCQTMATTFPLRRTPRVFTSCMCVIFSALSKFMATMTACYLNLAVFAMTFRYISYLAVVAHLLKSIIWVWPCWHLLRHQPIPLSKFTIIIYMIPLTLIFSFIYIHPFERRGKLFYYIFYLLSFLYELVNIYILSEANIGSITYYFTLKFLMFGFLSCYGLFNILHKYRNEEYELRQTRNLKKMLKTNTSKNESRMKEMLNNKDKVNTSESESRMKEMLNDEDKVNTSENESRMKEMLNNKDKVITSENESRMKEMLNNEDKVNTSENESRMKEMLNDEDKVNTSENESRMKEMLNNEDKVITSENESRMKEMLNDEDKVNTSESESSMKEMLNNEDKPIKLKEEQESPENRK